MKSLILLFTLIFLPYCTTQVLDDRRKDILTNVESDNHNTHVHSKKLKLNGIRFSGDLTGKISLISVMNKMNLLPHIVKIEKENQETLKYINCETLVTNSLFFSFPKIIKNNFESLIKRKQGNKSCFEKTYRLMNKLPKNCSSDKFKWLNLVGEATVTGEFEIEKKSNLITKITLNEFSNSTLPPRVNNNETLLDRIDMWKEKNNIPDNVDYSYIHKNHLNNEVGFNRLLSIVKETYRSPINIHPATTNDLENNLLVLLFKHYFLEDQEMKNKIAPIFDVIMGKINFESGKASMPKKLNFCFFDFENHEYQAVEYEVEKTYTTSSGRIYPKTMHIIQRNNQEKTVLDYRIHFSYSFG